MTSRYYLGKSQFRFTKKILSQRVIICATNSHTLYKTVMEFQIHILNEVFSFQKFFYKVFSSVIKSWKLWPSLQDYKNDQRCLNWKKTLFIVFDVERFHEYLYGCKSTIINDHQPLKSIFSKFIVSCLSHIQKFFLHLQKYKFDLNHSPRKTMLVLDVLSWACINKLKPKLDENILIHHMQF